MILSDFDQDELYMGKMIYSSFNTNIFTSEEAFWQQISHEKDFFEEGFGTGENIIYSHCLSLINTTKDTELCESAYHFTSVILNPKDHAPHLAMLIRSTASFTDLTLDDSVDYISYYDKTMERLNDESLAEELRKEIDTYQNKITQKKQKDHTQEIYDQAEEFYRSYNYDKARRLYEQIPDYKDSAEKRQLCVIKIKTMILTVMSELDYEQKISRRWDILIFTTLPILYFLFNLYAGIFCYLWMLPLSWVFPAFSIIKTYNVKHPVLRTLVHYVLYGAIFVGTALWLDFDRFFPMRSLFEGTMLSIVYIFLIPFIVISIIYAIIMIRQKR